MGGEPGSFGGYRVLGLLGIGATARVYRVADPAGGPDLAVKHLHAEVAATPEARRRFRREVELASRVRHAAIPRVAEQGDSQGRPWVAMELVEGHTLEERLAGGALAWETALEFAAQLVEALGHLHELNVVHRDVKPANVVIEESGRLRLLDLGLATTLLPDGMATSAGSRAGTPRYMSPEQVLGLPVLPSSDLYAVGICLFEALTGESPYRTTNEAALLAAHVHGRPRPVPEGTGPAAIGALLAACLAKNPEQRYAMASELADDLRALLADPGLAPAQTMAGRKLGMRRLRGELPGRSRETAALRRWLQSVARGRPPRPLVVKGPPGSGRTALLEWAAAEALELGLSLSAEPQETGLRIMDDVVAVPPLVEGQALLAAGGPALAVEPRLQARVLELDPLGSGALRRWIKDELGLRRVDARDLEFIERWSGGWPGRVEPLLLRWQESLRRDEPPAAGAAATLLEADEAERARIARVLGVLEEETRLLVELLAWLQPARTAPPSAAEAVGMDPDALDRSLGAAMRAGLALSVQGGLLGLRDPVLARVVRELTDGDLVPDLVEAALEILQPLGDGTALTRRAELLLESGDDAQAGTLAVSAMKRLREEERHDEATRLTEEWIERVDWTCVDDAAELIRRSLRHLGDTGEPARARSLLAAASSRVAAPDQLALRFEEAASLWREGDLPAARGGYLALARDSRRLRDVANRFRALNGLASIDWASGRHARAARHLAALGQISDSVEASERIDWLRTRAAMALMMGDDATAESCLDEAWAAAEAHGETEALLFLAEERSALLMRLDRLPEAALLLADALVSAREHGNQLRVAYLAHLLGTLHLQARDVVPAGRCLRAARRAAFRTKHSYLIACNEELLVRIAAARGEFDEARRRIRLTRKHDPGVPNVEAYLRLAEADLALLGGDLDGARERLLAADELLESIDDEGLLFRKALLLLTGAADEQGEGSSGREVLEGLRPEWARGSFAFRFDEFVRRLASAPAAGPPAAGR